MPTFVCRSEIRWDTCLWNKSSVAFQRDANPEKFTNRNYNKIIYTIIGLEKFVFPSKCRDLHKKIELEVDGKRVELPPLEGILILNIMRFVDDQLGRGNLCVLQLG